MNVFVIYDENNVWGVAVSLESAAQCLRQCHIEPNDIKWTDPVPVEGDPRSWSIIGHDEGEWLITRYELFGANPSYIPDPGA